MLRRADTNHQRDAARIDAASPPARRCRRAPAATFLLAAALAASASGGAAELPSRGADGRLGGSSGGAAADATTSIPPSATARTLDRTLDRLVAAYEPAAVRARYIVAAKVLWEDAVRSSTDPEMMAEREAVLLQELGRTEQSLRTSRSALVRTAPHGRAAAVKRLMLESIDARARALGTLRRHLAPVADHGAVLERPADPRWEERWSAYWNESARAAREALNLLQDLRSAAGLPPEREDAVR